MNFSLNGMGGPDNSNNMDGFGPDNFKPLNPEVVDLEMVSYDGSLAKLLETKKELEVEYPTPESAIESYRDGTIDDKTLELIFTQDEIDYIHAECEKRNLPPEIKH